MANPRFCSFSDATPQMVLKLALDPHFLRGRPIEIRIGFTCHFSPTLVDFMQQS